MFGLRRRDMGIMPGDQPSLPQSPIGFPSATNPIEGGMEAIQPAKKRGLFGSGIGLAQIAGAAGDALSVYGGGPAIYAQRVNQQRQEEQQAQLAEAQRAADWQDWVKREQWKRDNPEPVNNDTVNDYNFLREKLGEEGALQYLRNLGDPMVNMTLPGNRVYSGPRSGLGTAMGAGSNVDAQPTTEDGMDYTPGPGGRANPSNWKPTGGGAPAARVPFSGQIITPPMRLRHGSMTSGRRTPEGNRLVGGVPNSRHVTGNAVDYDGPNLNALLAEVRQQFPGAKAFIHAGHVHTQDDRIRAPYFGRRGTTGLRGK